MYFHTTDYQDAQAYFFHMHGTPYVKIGWAMAPRKRLRLIQKMVKRPLTPLVWIDGGHAMEQRLHLYFWRWHIAHEWFWFPCDAFQPLENLYQLIRDALAKFRDEAEHPDQCWTEFSYPWEPEFLTERGMRRKDNHTDRQAAMEQEAQYLKTWWDEVGTPWQKSMGYCTNEQ